MKEDQKRTTTKRQSDLITNDEWQEFVSRFWRSMYLIYAFILFVVVWLIYDVVTSFEVGLKQSIATALVGGAVLLLGSVHAYIVYRMNALNLAKIQHLMMHDELTELLNLRAGQQSLEEEFARAERYEQTFSVLSVDLDGFKKVNDTLGHVAGDQLLEEVGEVLRNYTRKTDIAARVGGDEFLIILPNTGIDGALVLASRIIQNIGAIKVNNDRPESDSLSIGASIGVAAFPEHGTGREQLVQKADQALYNAKRSGRSTYSLPDKDE